MADDYWSKTTRSMLGTVKEVGAMPFILFQYFLTYESAADGIKPSLQTIADDLGIKKNAVCNLKKILILKKWIREENGEISILKTFENHSEKMNEPFRKNECHSEKMNDRSEILYGTVVANKGNSYEIEEERNVPNGTSSETSDLCHQAKMIFEFWQTTLGHPRAKFSRDKKRKIVARLREGFSTDELKLAVNGCKASAYHQGDNKTSTIYDSIDLIFRNAEKVEQFIGFTVADNPSCEVCSNHPERHRINTKETGYIWTPNGIIFCVCHPKFKKTEVKNVTTY